MIPKPSLLPGTRPVPDVDDHVAVLALKPPLSKKEPLL